MQVTTRWKAGHRRTRGKGWTLGAHTDGHGTAAVPDVRPALVRRWGILARLGPGPAYRCCGAADDGRTPAKAVERAMHRLAAVCDPASE